MYPEAVFHSDNLGYSPMHMVAQTGNLKNFETLFQFYPDAVKIKAKNGRTPLHFAAQQGHTILVEKIISFWDTGVSAASDDGRLPVHLAAFSGNIECVQMLCSKFPHVVKKKTHLGGFLPILIAAEHNHFKICEYLLSLFPDCLLEYDDFGRYPLEMALMQRNSMLSNLFLTAAPSCSCSANPLTGRLPLHIACLFNMPLDILTMLVSANPAAIQSSDIEGYIPLHFAAQIGNIDSFTMLYESMVTTVLCRALNGRTCLHFAAQEGHIAIVRYVLTRSPGLELVPSHDGYTPLHLAAYNGHSALAVVLLSDKRYEMQLSEAITTTGWLPLHSLYFGTIPYDVSLATRLLQASPRSVTHRTAARESPLDALVHRLYREMLPVEALPLTPFSTHAMLARLLAAAFRLEALRPLLRTLAVDAADQEALTALRVVCWRSRRPLLLVAYRSGKSLLAKLRYNNLDTLKYVAGFL